MYIDALRVGMFIQLELGWINHPFPMSSFRLSSPDQIRVLREIGLQSVRYIPAKSTVTAANAGLRSEEARDEPESDAMVQAELGAADLLAQFNARQQHCNLRFQEATRTYAAVSAHVRGLNFCGLNLSASLRYSCIGMRSFHINHSPLPGKAYTPQ